MDSIGRRPPPLSKCLYESLAKDVGREHRSPVDAEAIHHLVVRDRLSPLECPLYDGNRSTKAEFLADTKSGASKPDSFEFGPMDVKVLGNVAIVQGTDTEKSSTHGEDTSGKWVWMDVFVKRDGRRQAVRSQSARVK